MTSAERQERIVKLLETEKFISVHKLARILHVSEPTVRRDLTILEKSKLARRTHGGAAKSLNGYAPIIIRDTIASESKRAIARLAVQLINAGDTIFIDSSSTAKHLANLLTEGMQITIVSNSFDVCRTLASLHIRSYCIGGLIDEMDHAIRGPFAVEFIQRFRFDIAFFSCSSLSIDGYLCGNRADGVALIHTLLPQSKKRVLLCSSEKVGTESPYVICSVKDIDIVLCDIALPSSIKQDIGANRAYPRHY